MMNCEDFLRQFRDALDGKVSENVIQDHVNYYRSYINSQIAGGRSESDVLGMLGDPRLLAKTIEESSKFASDKEDQGGNGAYSSSGYGNQENYGRYRSAGNDNRGYTEMEDEKRGTLPGWLITGIVLVVVFLVFTVVSRVFIILAPYIMVFLLAGFVVRAIHNWWQRK